MVRAVDVRSAGPRCRVEGQREGVHDVRVKGRLKRKSWGGQGFKQRGKGGIAQQELSEGQKRD